MWINQYGERWQIQCVYTSNDCPLSSIIKQIPKVTLREGVPLQMAEIECVGELLADIGPCWSHNLFLFHVLFSFADITVGGENAFGTKMNSQFDTRVLDVVKTSSIYDYAKRGIHITFYVSLHCSVGWREWTKRCKLVAPYFSASTEMEMPWRQGKKIY